MRLGLILGAKGEGIKASLIGNIDSAIIDCYSNIDEFIEMSLSRDLYYNRIILTSTNIKGLEDLYKLYNFWNECAKSTEIVVLTRGEKDKEFEGVFLNKFSTSNVTVLDATRGGMTIHKIIEATNESILVLRERYVSSDYLRVDIEEDNFVEDVSQENLKEKQGIKQEKVEKKKGGFFRGIFGGKSEKKVAKPKEEEHVEMEQEETVTEEELSNFIGGCNKDYEKEFDEAELEEISENKELEVQNHIEEECNGVSDVNEGFCSQEVVEKEITFEEENGVGVMDNLEEDFNFTDSNEHFQIYDRDKKSNNIIENETDIKENNYDIEERIYNIKEKETNIKEEDIEFDDFDFTYEEPKVEEPIIESNEGESDVDIFDDDDFAVGLDEEGYRKVNDKPKVIEKTVVKEVIKEVVKEVKVSKDGKFSTKSMILENVLNGKAHKVIVVTGDRGSCVTYTALSIMKYFAEHTEVLYFDCDSKTHGLLHYIDYFEFKNYESTHLSGVKLCKSKKAFEQCVCKWDKNIDILTTDYGVDVEDNELIETQSVVSEMMEDYGVIVVDCPMDRLHCLKDLILLGNVVVCVEDNKRGFMNTLFQLDSLRLSLKYKRLLINNGLLLRTKVNKNSEYNQVVKYIDSILDFEECNWLSMLTKELEGGKVTPELASIMVDR